MNKLRITFLSLLLALLPLCFISTCQAGEIAIQTEQLQQLENNNRLLKLKLITLEQELTTLKKPQAELLNELNEAKKSLKVMQSELAASSNSLENVRALQKRTKTSLDKLEKQIKKQRNKYRLQKASWFLGGCLVGYFRNRAAH